ncbi:hypothetical protein KIK84_04000 [Curvibacter sp. CHRR-16]|uniref:hypothetical protein n=1 Tax=Curvibacter sp. CHRR-16 TaxID=2835872 RepID=UPI001BD9F9AA|nr:hypothetical protein [Curvibacter sp. CHRR-16]MBT0569475.1 hypothetical protein [Curvibacter sp. CHRR-16]
MDGIQNLMHLGWAGRPLQPALWLQQLWLYGGWAVVLAWALSALVLVAQRLGAPRARAWQRVWGCALLAVSLAGLPGVVSPVYWWGLAFQYPSAVLVLWCAVDLLWQGVAAGWGETASDDTAWQRREPTWAQYALVALAAGWGWVLALDSFALWPVAVYPWGVGPIALAWVLVAVAALWIGMGSTRMVLVLCLSLLLYVLLRLPTGNVWDALLDPWLCLGLHGVLVRALWRYFKRKSA